MKDLNYNIIHAKNGYEAVSNVINNPSIDLVLMDVGMPEMDGLEATEKIRESNETMPIVAITGYVMEEDIQNTFDAGCNEYLSKPIIEKKLFDILEKYMKNDVNAIHKSSAMIS